MCTNAPIGRPIWFSDHDETKGTVQCVELHELAKETKVAYWVFKAARWILDRTPPEVP